MTDHGKVFFTSLALGNIYSVLSFTILVLIDLLGHFLLDRFGSILHLLHKILVHCFL